jgi:putative DNA primase/helicase
MIHGSELGLTQMLIDKHGEHLKFVPEWGKWLCWDGQRWAIDITGQVRRWIQNIVEEEHASAKNLEDEDLIKYWRSCATRNRILAVETLAKTYEGVPIGYEELDTHSHLFNTVSGTVDLNTGEVGPHNPKHLLTKLSPAKVNIDAKAPMWDQFLLEIMDYDTDMVDFLQRIFGYALTGETKEQVYFFLHGFGSNGKSTLVNTVLKVMGDYGQTCAPDLFVSKRGDAHPTGVARLCGARFVAATEIEGNNKKLAEQLLKQVTGGERMVARRMREDYWEFEPVLKLFLSANSKPEIDGDDHGTWRRIILVPFVRQFNDKEKKPELPAELLGETAGILNWLIKGCLAWREQGLAIPAKTKNATQEYRAENDLVQAFIDDETSAEDGAMPTLRLHGECSIEKSKLYDKFDFWRDGNDYEHKSKKWLSNRLKTRGTEDKRIRQKWHWVGIGSTEEYH